MLSVTHTITSAALGAQMGSPISAFGAALLLHFLLDSLRHWNIYLDRHRWPYFWTALDVTGGLFFTFLLIPNRFLDPPVLAAIIGGNLPDIDHGLLDLWNTLRVRRGRTPRVSALRRRFHHAIQFETLRPVEGLAWQVLLIVGSVLLLRV